MFAGDSSVRDRLATAAKVAVGMGWIVVVSSGLWVMHAHDATPGAPGSPGKDWPAGSRIRFDRARVNLVMLAHPRCPCTRASIEELAALIEAGRDTVTAHIVFFVPREADRSWSVTESRRRAESIPGVRVLEDVEGAEAIQFGVESSGHVLVYDRTGRRIYSGGVTSARGRYGDNPARRRISKIIRDAAASDESQDGPTFGCPLLDTQTRNSRRR
jgi:hypothetical protein